MWLSDVVLSAYLQRDDGPLGTLISIKSEGEGVPAIEILRGQLLRGASRLSARQEQKNMLRGEEGRSS